jgi:hypothetical protein
MTHLKPILRIMAIIGGIAGILAIGWYAEHTPRWQPLRQSLQRSTLPFGMLAYGAKGKILRQLQAIQVMPNPDATDLQSPSGTFWSKRALVNKKARSGIQVYGFDSIAPEALPGSTIIPQAVLNTNPPVLSLVVAQNDLTDPDLGLLTHPDAKGRNWERPAFLSYFEQGRLRFASGVGLRIHGGVARDAPKKSFRIYFRDIYGAAQFAPHILFDGQSDPILRLVVRSEFETAGLFANSLAYDISRQIGALAPYTRPVKLFINGEEQGVYILIEHISEGYLRAHFGHPQFLLAQSASYATPVFGSYQQFRQFIAWAIDRASLSMSEAAQKIDLDNFARWLLSVLFCATPDALQGPLLLDLSQPDAKWFWVNWDMDHSFVMTNLNAAPNAWEEDVFDRFYMREDPRAYLYHRLRLCSPEFRRYFTRMFVDTMNHRLTDAFLSERQRYYAALSSAFRYDARQFNEDVANFMRYRKSVLRDQMDTYFAAGKSYPCLVQGPSEVNFEIDGYPEQAGYFGWYFEQTPITISLTETGNRTFSYWLINGKERRQDRILQYTVTAPTTIVPVF